MPDSHRPVQILNVIRFPIGGIRSYLRYTYSCLDAHRYAATIVTVDREEARLLPEAMHPLSVELHTVSETRPVLGLLRAVQRLIRSGRHELVHSQGTTAAMVSAVSARFHRVPHVVTLHETFRREQFRGPGGEAKRHILARTLGMADAIATVTSDARDNLLEVLPLARAAADRVEVIRNGVAVDMLLRDAAHTPLNLRGRWQVPNEVVLLGYVGRFMPEKGFDVLLEATRRLQGVKDLPAFVIATLNDGAFVREYQQQIAESGLRDRFIFAGFQPSAAGTLAELDAVIVPSRREACCLVAMEALVLGCPLIASDCIGLREVTAGTPALSSSAGDAASLAAAIEQFLRHRVVLKERARAFEQTARLAFDSSQTAHKLTSMFERALSASDRGRRPALA